VRPCASRIPESPLNVVEEELHPPARSPAHRKMLGKTKLVNAGSGSPIMQEVGGSFLFEKALHQAHTQGLGGAALPGSIYSENVNEGSVWVLEKMICFCKMGLVIEGREIKLLSFLASVEANRMNGEQLVEVSMGDAVTRHRLFSDEADR